RTSMPAAEASASTLETAPPCPTATGTLAGGGPGSWGPAGGAVAPTETTAAETARTVSFRATGRRMRTSGEGPLAQPTTSPCSRQERLAGRCGDAAPVPRAAGGGPRPSRALVRHRPAGVGRTSRGGSNTGLPGTASMRAHDGRHTQCGAGCGDRRRGRRRAGLDGPHVSVPAQAAAQAGVLRAAGERRVAARRQPGPGDGGTGGAPLRRVLAARTLRADQEVRSERAGGDAGHGPSGLR